MTGVIYKRTCKPTVKSYVGQTTNEDRRKREWENSKRYCGILVDDAREKYGVDCWTYEHLYELESDSLENLKKLLDKYERKAISEEGTLHPNGYNYSIGGRGYCVGGKQHHGWGMHTPEQTKRKMRLKMGKKIACYDKEGNLVKQFNSIREAAKYFNIDKNAISRAVRGLVQTSKGYYWKNIICKI